MMMMTIKHYGNGDGIMAMVMITLNNGSVGLIKTTKKVLMVVNCNGSFRPFL